MVKLAEGFSYVYQCEMCGVLGDAEHDRSHWNTVLQSRVFPKNVYLIYNMGA